MIDDLHARHLVGVDGVREVWLIRHADAYAGLASMEPGVVDPTLSALGRRQSALLAARLASVRLDWVWSSDLRRARETAEAIAAPHGLEVRVDARLREVRTWWDEGRAEPLSEPDVYPFPEPEGEVAERMRAALAEVVASLGDSGSDGARGTPRAAVVSHNASIAITVSRLLGLGWGRLPIMPQFTSVTVLAFKADQAVVQSIADATHLSASPS